MTPARYRAELLREVHHDVNRALDIAIERLGVAGLCLSAGYIRAKPPAAALPAKARIEPLEIPDEQTPS